MIPWTFFFFFGRHAAYAWSSRARDQIQAKPQLQQPLILIPLCRPGFEPVSQCSQDDTNPIVPHWELLLGLFYPYSKTSNKLSFSPYRGMYHESSYMNYNKFVLCLCFLHNCTNVAQFKCINILFFFSSSATPMAYMESHCLELKRDLQLPAHNPTDTPSRATSATYARSLTHWVSRGSSPHPPKYELGSWPAESQQNSSIFFF